MVLLSEFNRGDVGDLFLWICDIGSSEEFAMFVMICWSIWIARNDRVFQGKKQFGIDVLNRARRVHELYLISSVPNNHARAYNSKNFFLAETPPGILKNVDASVFNHLDFFGVGLVGRDSSGVVVCAQGEGNSRIVYSSAS